MRYPTTFQKRPVTTILLFSAVAIMCALVQAIPATGMELDAGTEFFVAFPDTVDFERREAPGPVIDTFALVLYAEKGAYVTIAGPGGYVRTANIPPDGFEVVYLDDREAPASRIVADSLGRVTRDVFHVLSTSPVTVTAWMYTMAGADAWTVPPVSAWDTRYAINAPGPAVQWSPDSSSGKLQGKTVILPTGALVVAASDSTVVRVPGPADGETIQYLMGRGDVLSLAWDSIRREKRQGYDLLHLVDISGALVEADKPVAVTTYGYTPPTGALLLDLANRLPDLCVSVAASQRDQGLRFIIPHSGKLDTLDNYPPIVATVRRIIALRTLAAEPATAWTENLAGQVVKSDSVAYLDPEFNRREQSYVITSDKPLDCLFTVQRDRGYLWNGGSIRVAPTSSWSTRAVLLLPASITDSTCRIAIAGIGEVPPAVIVNSVPDETILWKQYSEQQYWSAWRDVRPGDRVEIRANDNGAVWGYSVGTSPGLSLLTTYGNVDSSYDISSWYGTASRGHAVEFSRVGNAAVSAHVPAVNGSSGLAVTALNRELLYLSLEPARGAAHLQVFDVGGRLVQAREDVRFVAGVATVQCGALSPGVYVARVKNSSGSWYSTFAVDP